MAAELIGRCRCPLCSGTARLSLAKTGLAVVTCNGCNFQGFARSDNSDARLRALVVREPAAPAPEPAPEPAPAPPAPVPPAPPPKPAWGIGSF